MSRRHLGENKPSVILSIKLNGLLDSKLTNETPSVVILIRVHTLTDRPCDVQTCVQTASNCIKLQSPETTQKLSETGAYNKQDNSVPLSDQKRTTSELAARTPNPYNLYTARDTTLALWLSLVFSATSALFVRASSQKEYRNKTRIRLESSLQQSWKWTSDNPLLVEEDRLSKGPERPLR